MLKNNIYAVFLLCSIFAKGQILGGIPEHSLWLESTTFNDTSLSAKNLDLKAIAASHFNFNMLSLEHTDNSVYRKIAKVQYSFLAVFKSSPKIIQVLNPVSQPCKRAAYEV